MKKAIIAGAGPAGLTAASELLDKTDIQPVVLETDNMVGGISRTVAYKGNRMDIGGHRFFSKSREVTDWWLRTMPMQGAPALDDLLLDKQKPLAQGGADPEKQDRVMLLRERVSRIFFLRRFFDYPISLKFRTFANMGLKNTLAAMGGYLLSCVHKRDEKSLEDFYINRFGKPLYRMFFENYTEKVWGVHPSRLGADWGAQRVKGLSIWAIIKDIASKPFRGKDNRKVETSLIEQFVYPKFGPGQLWECVADDISRKGADIRLQHTVVGVEIADGRVVAADIRQPDGTVQREACDYLLSSMPLKELVPMLHGIDVPDEVRQIAEGLPYRDFITVGLLVRDIALRNTTRIKTYAGRIPDTWIYIQERDVKVGRVQIFNNWSPYMVADYKNTLFIGLEYFATEGDELWTMPKDDFIKMAVAEMEKIGMLHAEDVLDATQIKVKKAYPAYYATYGQLDTVRQFLDRIPNLYCIGRNGQHRYNNMDHSMLTAMEAVKNIQSGTAGKENIWSVNTEEEYHEIKK